MKRRTLLAAGGLSASIGLCGCLEDVRSTADGDRTDSSQSPSDERDGDPDALESTDEPPESTAPLTQFQYDAQNTGVAAASPPEAPRVQWNTTLPPIDGGLAATESQLVVAAGGGLIALDAADGSRRWAVRVGHDIPAAPVLTDDTAYVTTWNGGSQDRGVAAIALEDGRQRWRAIPDVDVASAPTLADGTLYVGGSLNSTEVIALDATDGRVQWRFEAGQYATTPAVADGLVYVGGGSEHAAYALEADTGEKVWRLSTDDRVWGAPTVVDRTVYVGARDGTLYAVAPETGEVRWETWIGSDVRASVAATDETVFVSDRGTFAALDAADGTERWTVELADWGFAPTVSDGGDEVVVADHAEAVCLEAATGEEVWRREGTPRSISDMGFRGIQVAPVVADDATYVASHGGDVHALAETE